MAVCREYRIPWSQFQGWSKPDRDKAIWDQIRRAQTCQGCGTHPDEWSPARGGDRHAYAAEEVICRGCQVLQGAQSRVEKTAALAKMHGLTVRLARRQRGSGGADTGSDPQ